MLDLLLSLPIFAGVSPADLSRLLALVDVKDVPAEGLLMNVGEPGVDLSVVLRGGFSVELGEVGATLPLAFAGPGEVLGEAVLFRPGTARSARVRAVSDSLVMGLAPAVLDQLTQEGSRVPRALEEAVMRTLARRIHSSVQAIDDVLTSAMELEEPKGALARLRDFFSR